MNNTTIKAEIVAHSINPQEDELISVLCTFPRIILAEVNTHRMLSKNTSSSRAIPFKKMVQAVKENPFIPIAWQKEHKGMQGNDYLDEHNSKIATYHWLKARDFAVAQAEYLNGNFTKEESVTKQLCNRLLEPFMWTTMLITGSRQGWDNFFSLRSPEYHLENVPIVNEDLSLNSKTLTLVEKSKKELLKQINEIDSDSYTGFKTIINNYSDLDWLKLNKGQAEIHMITLAEEIYDAMNESTPKQLQAGEWHIPFGDKIDLIDWLDTVNDDGHLDGDLDEQDRLFEVDKIKISTAMAAHTSYTIVGGEAVKSYDKWIELHDKLITCNPPHSSPMEHCARAMSYAEYNKFFKGCLDNVDLSPSSNFKEFGWCNNLKGFIPYRYFIDNKIEL